jgi:hypothetical protein
MMQTFIREGREPPANGALAGTSPRQTQAAAAAPLGAPPHPSASCLHTAPVWGRLPTAAGAAAMAAGVA